MYKTSLEFSLLVLSNVRQHFPLQRVCHAQLSRLSIHTLSLSLSLSLSLTHSFNFYFRTLRARVFIYIRVALSIEKSGKNPWRIPPNNATIHPITHSIIQRKVLSKISLGIPRSLPDRSCVQRENFINSIARKFNA